MDKRINSINILKDDSLIDLHCSLVSSITHLKHQLGISEDAKNKTEQEIEKRGLKIPGKIYIGDKVKLNKIGIECHPELANLEGTVIIRGPKKRGVLHISVDFNYPNVNGPLSIPEQFLKCL